MKVKKIECYNCHEIFEGSFALPNNNSPCPDCKKKGFKKIILNETKNIKCYNCHEIFKGYVTLPSNNSPCPKCRKKGFKKIILNETKNIKCYNCNNIFIGSFALPNNNSPCPDCRKKGFKRNFSKEKLEIIQLKRNNSIKNKTKKIICFNCKNIFNANIYLSDNSPCPDCKNKEIKKRILKDKKNICFNCNKTFITNRHSANDILPCPDCRKKGFGKNYSKEKLKEINLKFSKTMLKNHNVDHPSKMKNYNDKIKETNQRRRGVDHHSQIKLFENIKRKLKNLNLKLIDKEFKGIIFNHNWKCTKCNNTFKHSWNMLSSCKICYPRVGNSSIEELEIFEYIRCFNISNNIILNDTQKINPLELDIYIPEKNIAIEFDGLYHHSQELQELNINENHPYTPQTYHLYKTQKCEELGIQLIHIFEDEWIFKQEIVKSRLKQILGSNSSQRIHARKCIIKEISPKRKNDFLNEFHIQGPDSSSIKLGSFHGEDLVSIMTFSKGNIAKGSKSKVGVWELNRFCSDSNFHIPGIAGKLLSYFKKNYDWNEIFSYADRRWSKGNLYYKLGFKLENITKPNYWYFKLNEMKRIHRFSLRKRPDEPKDITENVLRLNEGYRKIWDCGSLKFKLLKN